MGHRFKVQNGHSGCCDCGDFDSINKNGFCSNHCGEIKCEEKLNPEVEKRLGEVLEFIFELLFEYCDEHTSHMKLFDGEGFGEDESLLEIETIEMFLFNIIAAASFFITKYCKDKLLFQMYIGGFMLRPLGKKLRHNCEVGLFEKTFASRPVHVCQHSVVKLLFMYSISLNKLEKNISDIFYSLSVNPVFRRELSDTFLSSLNYILIMYNSY